MAETTETIGGCSECPWESTDLWCRRVAPPTRDEVAAASGAMRDGDRDAFLKIRGRTPHADEPPSAWCPLRAGPVTLRLAEGGVMAEPLVPSEATHWWIEIREGEDERGRAISEWECRQCKKTETTPRQGKATRERCPQRVLSGAMQPHQQAEHAYKARGDATLLDAAADALALVAAAKGAHGLSFWSEGTRPGRARAGLTLGDTEHTLASWCPTAADARRVLAHRLIATALALLEER